MAGGPPPLALSRRSNSSPSMRGIFMSVTITCAWKRFQLFERFLAVGGGFDVVAPQRDHAGQRRALRFFVVHHQDSRAFRFHSPYIVTACRAIVL